MRAVNARSLFIFSALLLLASSAYADGLYLRTKDKKTLVWNNYPAPGEAVTWSGARDKDGYASGEGTVTWYSAGRKFLSGTRLPFFRNAVVSGYSGKMVRGKLDGPVITVKTKGQIFHGTFVNGNKVGDWAAGPAPSPSSPRDESVLVADRTAKADQPRNEPIGQEAVVEAPAEGSKQTPIPAQPTNQDVAKPSATEKRNEQSASGRSVTQKPGDSLRAVIGPPSSLRTRDAGEPLPQAPVSSPPARPRLTKSEVIELADAKARTQGYSLDDYRRPQVRYTPENDTWSLFYDQKSNDGMVEVGKQLSVTVADKTKKTSIAAGR